MIAFYISGHGFGHASRDIEIINAVAARRPGTHWLLRTSVARWLLDRTISCRFDVESRPCDTGVVQIDSLRLDPTATIARAGEFYATLEARALQDAALLRSDGITLVLSDAPPLACAAAACAGIPCIVIGNFTWDWIYQEYREELAFAPDLIPTVQSAYRAAEGAWRLPMHGGFETFDRVINVPFVARHAHHEPDETRARLGLPADRRLALSSFGGYGVHGLKLATLDCFDEWDVVVTGQQRPADLPPHVHFFEEEQIYDAGIRYEDVVRACDAVVTKPGYGIISECIANETAIVYTSRGRFAEYPILVADMSRYLRAAFIAHDELFAGRWHDALHRAVDAPAPLERPRTDGASVIADMILTRLATPGAH